MRALPEPVGGVAARLRSTVGFGTKAQQTLRTGGPKEQETMADGTHTHQAPAGGVRIDMPGRLGDEMPIPGWPNLIRVANLAISHFNELCDRSCSHRAYVGASLGIRTPAFVHAKWDWVEASSYALLGRIAARRLTGNTEGIEVETDQRRLTLASFHNLDGFAHRLFAQGWSEDPRVYLYEQARVLFTLMAWFLEAQDERLLVYVRGILRALMSASHTDGRLRRMNPPLHTGGDAAFGALAQIILVEPLMKYYELTDDSEALEFCEGVVNWALDPDTAFTDDRWRLSGWLRGTAAAITSITRFAAHTDSARLLDSAEKLFHSAIGLTAGYGATPDTEPCCTNMELTTAALALMKAGRGEWWDMIDRHFRNQTLECQFTDPSAVNIGHVEGEPGPWDDTRDILNRSVGGFSWATAREHIYDEWARLMLCCGGNAMWTLGKIVQNATTQDERGLSINLHFSLETPAAAITNHEPFEGKLEVVPRQEGSVRIRRPSYASKVSAEIDGSTANWDQDGSYLVFDSVRNGSRIVLTYPMPERTTEEVTKDTPGGWLGPKSPPVVRERIRTTWRGNTVLAIDYDSDSAQPKHRLYLHRMARYRAGQGRDDREQFFLPDQSFNW
jgi:hypothetical protein